jgi:LPS export ABC transporter protein LptC
MYTAYLLASTLPTFGLENVSMINRFPDIFFLRMAACITGCLLFSACENSQRSLDEWKEKRTMVEEARNIQTIFSQGGSVRSRLTAPLMLRYTHDTVYVEFPKSLRMIFFDSAGKEQSRLDAHYGKYMEYLNKAYLRDSVVVANVNGDTLWTPDLWWDQNSQRFYTDKQVRIYRKGDRIYGGKGLEASQDLTDILIKQPTGTVIVPDSLSATY